MSDVISCTAETPWDGRKASHQMVRHAGARPLGDEYARGEAGLSVTMKCPHCGTEWLSGDVDGFQHHQTAG